MIWYVLAVEEERSSADRSLWLAQFQFCIRSRKNILMFIFKWLRTSFVIQKPGCCWFLPIPTVCRGSKECCFYPKCPAGLLKECSCQSRVTYFRHHKTSNQTGFWTPSINRLWSFFTHWVCGGSENTSYRINVLLSNH